MTSSCSKLILADMAKMGCTKPNPTGEIFNQVHILWGALHIQVKLMKRLVPIQRFKSYFEWTGHCWLSSKCISLSCVVGTNSSFAWNLVANVFSKAVCWIIQCGTLRMRPIIQNTTCSSDFVKDASFVSQRLRVYHSHSSAACDILAVSGHNGHKPEWQ